MDKRKPKRNQRYKTDTSFTHDDQCHSAVSADDLNQITTENKKMKQNLIHNGLSLLGMKRYNYHICGLLIVALACFTFSGCQTSNTGASGSTASMSASSSKNAGRLIIQRVADLGTAEVLNISIDGKQVATLPRGQTYSGSLSPGQHVVSVLAIPNALHPLPTQKRLSVQAGQTYNFTAMWQGNRLVLM